MGGRTNPRALAALAITARQVIDALATTIAVEQIVYDGIDKVAAFARGEKIPKPELKQLWTTLDKLGESRRGWKTPQEKDYYWAVGAVGTLARIAESGTDYQEHVLTNLSYGLAEQGKTSGRPNCPDVAEWFAAAKKQVRSVSGETIAKKVNAKAAAIEAAALGRIAKVLGGKGALLAKKGVRWSAKRVGTPAELKALLAKKKLKATKAVLAFDAAFGGLMLPASTDEADDWFETGSATYVGAFSCLKQPGKPPDGGHSGHVPIVLTTNDNEVYLDDKGGVWAMDTIEDSEAVKLKQTPVQMIVKLLEDI